MWILYVATYIHSGFLFLPGQSENASNVGVEVIKVNSDKELVREIERIAFNMAPDKEWSIRTAAMQRLEGIVLGGILTFSEKKKKFKSCYM